MLQDTTVAELDYAARHNNGLRLCLKLRQNSGFRLCLKLRHNSEFRLYLNATHNGRFRLSRMIQQRARLCRNTRHIVR